MGGMGGEGVGAVVMVGGWGGMGYTPVIYQWGGRGGSCNPIAT